VPDGFIIKANHRSRCIPFEKRLFETTINHEDELFNRKKKREIFIFYLPQTRVGE